MRTRGKPIPDEARRAILAWEPGDATTLNDLARSLGVIPSSARTLRSRHRRGPRQREGLRDGNEARRPDRCGVEVLRSPTDQFDVGNKFTMTDLEFMVPLSSMPDGTVLKITPRGKMSYMVEMRDRELTRIDTMTLYADEIVATELAITFYGSKMWSGLSQKAKAAAIKRLLPDARQLQARQSITFNTILRLRQSADISDPATGVT